MSSLPQRRLTSQEYLAIERLAEKRSEFHDGVMFAMAGSSTVHASIQINLASETRAQLKGTPCRVLGSDQRVHIPATGLYTYPDMLVACQPLEYDEDGVRDTLTNPRTIVEVLSDSNEQYDRGGKFRHYQTVPSLQEYILVAQDAPLIERYVRQPDNSWLLTMFAGLDSLFEFASIPVKVPFAEIYRDVEFRETTQSA